jgi:hypothetical protein
MDTLPKPESLLLPCPGAYVAFKIDPVATFEHFNDPVATEAAQKIQFKEYIAGGSDVRILIPLVSATCTKGFES